MTVSGFSPKENDALRGKVTQTTILSALAADATAEWPIFVAEVRARLLRVSIVAAATITGANTNTFHLNVLNKALVGVGTTEIGNRDFVSGTNSTGFQRYDIVAETAGKTMEAGEVLTLQREKIGTGMAMPQLLTIVTYELNG